MMYSKEHSPRAACGNGGTQVPDNFVAFARWIPCRSYVSCWHVSQAELAALWKIYAGQERIHRNKKLHWCIERGLSRTSEQHDNLHISQSIRAVQYIDYRTAHPYFQRHGGAPDVTSGRLCVRAGSEDHSEVTADRASERSIRSRLPDGPPSEETGREIPVDIESLIAAIYLAPSSPPWMLPTIRHRLRGSVSQGWSVGSRAWTNYRSSGGWAHNTAHLDGLPLCGRRCSPSRHAHADQGSCTLLAINAASDRLLTSELGSRPAAP